MRDRSGILCGTKHTYCLHLDSFLCRAANQRLATYLSFFPWSGAPVDGFARYPAIDRAALTSSPGERGVCALSTRFYPSKPILSASFLQPLEHFKLLQLLKPRCQQLRPESVEVVRGPFAMWGRLFLLPPRASMSARTACERSSKTKIGSFPFTQRLSRSATLRKLPDFLMP